MFAEESSGISVMAGGRFGIAENKLKWPIPFLRCPMFLREYGNLYVAGGVSGGVYLNIYVPPVFF